MKILSLFLFVVSSTYAQIDASSVVSGQPIQASKIVEIINKVNENSNSSQICYLKYILPSGSTEGATVAGTFVDRALNTTEGNCSFLTLSSNQFTVPAGDYNIHCTAPTYWTQRARLIVADSSNTPLVLGHSSFSTSGSDAGPNVSVMGSLSLPVPTTLKIRMSAQRNEPLGLGLSSDDGLDEVYTSCSLEKL